jgi:hypothetical protein
MWIAIGVGIFVLLCVIGYFMGPPPGSPAITKRDQRIVEDFDNECQARAAAVVMRARSKSQADGDADGALADALLEGWAAIPSLTRLAAACSLMDLIGILVGAGVLEPHGSWQAFYQEAYVQRTVAGPGAGRSRLLAAIVESGSSNLDVWP